jgi:hypothetical protein
MIVSLDIDGVLAGGEYIPEWDRTNGAAYAALPLIDPQIPEYIHAIAKRHSVYLISSRQFPGALDTTRLWLNKQRFCMTDFCGVIVGLNHTTKIEMVKLLRATLHFDDDYRVIEPLGTTGLLCKFTKTTYPWSQKFIDEDGWYCHDWNNLTRTLAE